MGTAPVTEFPDCWPAVFPDGELESVCGDVREIPEPLAEAVAGRLAGGAAGTSPTASAGVAFLADEFLLDEFPLEETERVSAVLEVVDVGISDTSFPVSVAAAVDAAGAVAGCAAGGSGRMSAA
jgi:hypothetical protein